VVQDDPRRITTRSSGPEEDGVGSLAWRIIGTGSAVLAAAAAQKGLNAGWKLATGNEPPTIPEDPETSWGEAIAWAVVSGAVLGLARLVATRRAAHFYMESTGEMPRALQREV
jgi:subtilisin family serine protease